MYPRIKFQLANLLYFNFKDKYSISMDNTTMNYLGLFNLNS